MRCERFAPTLDNIGNPRTSAVFRDRKLWACEYLQELADLGADRLVVEVGALDEDAVKQLCAPPTGRAEDLTVRSQ